MTPDELRALQAPLKARYREDPGAAVVTLRAEGDIGAPSVTCKVTTGRALVEAGLHPATGGTVTAEGDLDFRGTLGVARDAPVGFRGIRLSFDLRTKAPAEQLAKLLELTERYCVVYQTLVKSPPVAIRHTASD